LTIYLVRHVKAGQRPANADEDDRLRPVSKAGQRQARLLVDMLDGATFERIVSSPYLRCIESVGPLASVRDLAIEVSDALAEEATLDEALTLFRKHTDGGAVLCSHGNIIPMLLEYFAARGLDLGPSPGCAKGSVWALETSDGEVTRARYSPPIDDE
jgi:broad specificity phosphatase PhoE